MKEKKVLTVWERYIDNLSFLFSSIPRNEMNEVVCRFYDVHCRISGNISQAVTLELMPYLIHLDKKLSDAALREAVKR